MRKIIIYTALFGNYSGLIEQKKYKGVDYVCYTDNPNLKSSTWNIKIVEPPVKNDSTRSNRWYKINPHLHLSSQYEYSVYVDANILIIKDISKFVKENLLHNELLIFDHNQAVKDCRDCIYKEYEALVDIGVRTGNFKDDINKMTNQIERYKKEGFPKNEGLIFASVLIRKHNSQGVITLMEAWWDEVLNKSKRDQLSFNYVLWKQKFKSFSVINGCLRKGNPYFYTITHRKDFRWKVFRIRALKAVGLLKQVNREFI